METQAIESKFNDESKSKIESQANELILIKNPLLTTILPADLESFRIESESNRARRNRKPILSKSIPSIKNRIEIAKNEPGPPCYLPNENGLNWGLNSLRHLKKSHAKTATCLKKLETSEINWCQAVS